MGNNRKADGKFIKVKMVVYGWRQRRTIPSQGTQSGEIGVKSDPKPQGLKSFDRMRDHKSYCEALLGVNEGQDKEKEIVTDADSPKRKIGQSSTSSDCEGLSISFNTTAPHEELEWLSYCSLCDFKDPNLLQRASRILESLGLKHSVSIMGHCQLCIRFDSKEKMEEMLDKLHAIDHILFNDRMAWNDKLIKRSVDVWVQLEGIKVNYKNEICSISVVAEIPELKVDDETSGGTIPSSDDRCDGSVPGLIFQEDERFHESFVRDMRVTAGSLLTFHPIYLKRSY
ncbi:hypothetical protein PTKIN_Ptkin03bG0197000 [Pterospermum kingtungense]